jgi:enolase
VVKFNYSLPPNTTVKVEDALARKVLDSRGRWTVEMELKIGGRWSRASVPEGRSRGRYEAKQFPAEKSLKLFPDFRKKIVGKDFGDQAKFDSHLMGLAGEKKAKFGVDLVLAASIAFFRRGLKPKAMPTPMLNVINGGMHAGGELAVQEFMIVPMKFGSFREKLEASTRIYTELRASLQKKYGPAAINVGDEGGLVPPMKTTEEALSFLEEVIGAAGMLDKVKMSIDCAASSYFKGGKYHIDGKELAPAEYIEALTYLTRSFHLFSVEDPLREDDFRGFSDFLTKSQAVVVGDDLTVTDLGRVQKAFGNQSINAVLVKPNQVGTVTEALEVVDFCRKNGMKWIISHRSGETTDAFISELAAATSSPFIKAGAPCRGERTAKYNQLLRLEEKL